LKIEFNFTLPSPLGSEGEAAGTQIGEKVKRVVARSNEKDAPHFHFLGETAARHGKENGGDVIGLFGLISR
jgi:hypothetical protein